MATATVTHLRNQGSGEPVRLVQRTTIRASNSSAGPLLQDTHALTLTGEV